MPRPNRSDPKTKRQAVLLRKVMTPAERKLWSRLRNDQLGVTFRRQHAIGSYVPDFPWHRTPGRCARQRRISSLNLMDSLRSQHLEQEEYDEDRTAYLESQGYTVIRFWNNQVMNDIEGVIRAISHALELDKHGSHR